MEIRSAYSLKERFRTPVVGKTRTKLSMQAECDINNIMAKYQKSGAISHVNQHEADYGFASGDDFSESMRVITIAQDMFDHLPSSIRTRFGNSPAQFLDFVQDADNEAEAIELGLVLAPVAPVLDPSVADAVPEPTVPVDPPVDPAV